MPADDKPPPGFYTPHSDDALRIKQRTADQAVSLSEALADKMQDRGVDFGPTVNIHLRALGEEAPAAPEGMGGPPPPKVKPTVLAYRCVSRAAVTAELEISKGHLTRVVGFIEVGEVVQAKAIGETEGSMRTYLNTGTCQSASTSECWTR